MALLVGVALVAGAVTAISPCVLPLLPILLAGGVAGRRPLRIVGGLAVSFVVFTLFSVSLLDALGLPQDVLRNAAIALLLVVAATLLVPRAGALLERPLAGLTRFRAGGGGFALGASLGLVFVPCAGPVLAAVVANAARERFTFWTIAVAGAYALGAAIPMLAVAAGGRAVARRLRSRAPALRAAAGAAMGAVALGLVFHLDDRLTSAVPGYVGYLQSRIEDSPAARRELARLRGGPPRAATPGARLADYGPAPAFEPDGDWFNSAPLTLAGLRGKVVLVDFWTYSCINCLRTLPHLEAWYAAYRDDGFVVVGVHTPEFAFEHVAANVRAAIGRLGIRYPVFQDNRYRTWNAYANEYWPAEYLIDRRGRVRHVQLGEGAYADTERAIEALLGVSTGAAPVADRTPTEPTTPESYLGYERLDRYAGSPIRRDRFATYAFPRRLAVNHLAYAGRWRVEAQRIVAGRGARLRLAFHAKDVYLVLGGRGRVAVAVDGRPGRALAVDAYRLYTVRSSSRLAADALLELRFTPGVQAYAFTFG